MEYAIKQTTTSEGITSYHLVGRDARGWYVVYDTPVFDRFSKAEEWAKRELNLKWLELVA